MLTAVPTAGEYNITFSAADCSSGTCATSLSILDHAQFSIQPGQLAGLTGFPRWGDGKFNFKRRPVSIRWNHFTRRSQYLNRLFTIDIVDIAGNALQSLSENEVTVNASIVTSTRERMECMLKGAWRRSRWNFNESDKRRSGII